MTQIIEFFKFDQSELNARFEEITLEYEIYKPDFADNFIRYKEFFADYFPEGTDFRYLPGLYEFHSVDSGPDAAIAKVIELSKAGYGAVSGFQTVQNFQAGHYSRWYQEKPTKQIKADKALLLDLVTKRYQSDLDAKNAAEEERQIELLVQAAERKRQQEEEQRIQAIREQARIDLAAAYATGEVA